MKKEEINEEDVALSLKYCEKNSRVITEKSILLEHHGDEMFSQMVPTQTHGSIKMFIPTNITKKELMMYLDDFKKWIEDLPYIIDKETYRIEEGKEYPIAARRQIFERATNNDEEID